MNAIKDKQRGRVSKAVEKIPDSLIYERIDGKPVYYRGYKEVLNNQKTVEDIMGTSSLQGTIIEYLLRILFRSDYMNSYRILTNELGIHLENNNNLSADIAIYEKAKLPVSSADKHYTNTPPKVQIEVDIDADTENFDSRDGYIYTKTQKLLDFGVERVIWVLSANKRVLVASPDEDWQVIDWHKEIEILDNLTFCVGKYLKAEDSPFA